MTIRLRIVGSVVALIMLAGISVTVRADTATSTTGSPINGTITNVDNTTNTVTVMDATGKTWSVSVDGATAVTVAGHSADAQALKVGQEIQVSGRYMAYVGRFAAKTIAVTKDPSASSASTKAAAPASASRAAAPKVTAAAKPTVLRSDLRTTTKP